MRHTEVLDALGAQIAGGTLAAGDVLTLDQICERYSVSMTVAREAMRRLEAMRLLESRRRVGLIVRPVDDWDVFNPRVIRWRLAGPRRDQQLRSLTELRAAVEPLAAAATARSASRRTRESFVPLAARMRRLGEEGDLEAFLELDIEFHSAILRYSENEMFAALTDVVAEVLTGRTHLGLMPAHPEQVALDAHDSVARAIAAGDPAAAEAASRSIVDEVLSTIRAEDARVLGIPSP